LGLQENTKNIKRKFKEGEFVKSVNIQDSFLNTARKQHMSVAVFLTNGFQIKGVVRGFDQYVVVLDVMGKQNMIYKHAISTIIPQENLKYAEMSDSDEK